MVQRSRVNRARGRDGQAVKSYQTPGTGKEYSAGRRRPRLPMNFSRTDNRPRPYSAWNCFRNIECLPIRRERYSIRRNQIGDHFSDLRAVACGPIYGAKIHLTRTALAHIGKPKSPSCVEDKIIWASQGIAQTVVVEALHSASGKFLPRQCRRLNTPRFEDRAEVGRSALQSNRGRHCYRQRSSRSVPWRHRWVPRDLGYDLNVATRRHSGESLLRNIHHDDRTVGHCNRTFGKDQLV